MNCVDCLHLKKQKGKMYCIKDVFLMEDGTRKTWIWTKGKKPKSWEKANDCEERDMHESLAEIEAERLKLIKGVGGSSRS